MQIFLVQEAARPRPFQGGISYFHSDFEARLQAGQPEARRIKDIDLTARKRETRSSRTQDHQGEEDLVLRFSSLYSST